MQSTSWIALFRRIPGNLHDGLILGLTTGAEVVVQRVLKLDNDVVILRGRMSGSQDTGRVLVLPYANMISINFTKRLSESEVETIFGKNTQSFAADIELKSAGPGENENADAEAETEAGNDPKEAASPAKGAMPSKSMLIAKLRARLNESRR